MTECTVTMPAESSESPSPEGTTVSATCDVCGDAAFGKNFGVYSCESCKAFFRRNADKEAVFGRCDGACEITVETRTYCKRCRLAKCLRVGMRKELLKSKSRHHPPSPPGAGAGPAKKRKLSTSSSDSNDPQVRPIHIRPINGTSHYTQQPKVEPKEEPHELSTKSRKLLEEILYAFAMTFDIMPYIDRANPGIDLKPTPVEFINCIEGPTKCMVKFAKHLSTFCRVPIMDQVALLKAGVVETIVLFSSRNFDPQQGRWQVMEGNQSIMEMSPDLMTGADGDELTQQSMGKAVQVMIKLLKRIRGDKTIIKMLGVLNLFSPDRPGLTPEACRVIGQIQEDYAIMLQDYLTVTYPDQRTYFPEMMMMLTDIREVGENTGRLLASTDITKLSPFIVDIFDLDRGPTKVEVGP